MGVLAAQTGGEEAIVHLGIPEYQTTARDGVHICITTRRSPQLNVKSGLGIVSPKWTSTSPKSAARSVALSLTLLWTTQLSIIPILTVCILLDKMSSLCAVSWHPRIAPWSPRAQLSFAPIYRHKLALYAQWQPPA